MFEYRMCKSALNQPGKCSACDRDAHRLKSLDLSPLAKFMGPTRTATATANTVIWQDRFGRGFALKDDGVQSQIWGPVFDGTEPVAPTPQPDPSPIDKALDEKIKEAEFIARRKMKRNLIYHDQDAIERAIAQGAKDEKTERALGNAMSKLTHWESEFQDRLMPYRGPHL